MKHEGIVPNAITYNALIHASAGGGVKPEDNSSPSPAGIHEGVSSVGGAETGDNPSRSSSGMHGEVSIGGGVKPGDSSGSSPANTSGRVSTSGKDRATGQRRWDRVMPLVEEMERAG